MLAVFDRNPRAIILDRHLDRARDPVLHGFRCDPNHALLTSVSDRVRHQVRDHLLDAPFVEGQPRSPGVQLEFDLDPALIEQGRQGFEPGSDQGMEIRLHDLDRKRSARLGLRIQQIDDELIEAPTRLETLIDIVGLFPIQRPVRFVLQKATKA